MSKMIKPKVLVTRGDLPWPALKILEEKCDVEVVPGAIRISRPDLLSKISGKHGLLCLPGETVDREVLEHAGPQLKVVATASAGFDHLDLSELKKRNILVGIASKATTAATAELTVALVLATTRRLIEAHNEVVHGKWSSSGLSWNFTYMCGGGLVGAKVGIVGLGNIGMAVAKRLLPFEIEKIMYCGRQPKSEAAEVAAEFVSFEQLLRESDIIIVTCPLNETTKNMFGSAQFAMMKSNAVFINTSRGGIVDQDALTVALKTGQIAAAGLDVMTPEPLPMDHELARLKNCVLTPHMGTGTLEARLGMATISAYNIINALEGKAMPAQLC